MKFARTVLLVSILLTLLPIIGRAEMGFWKIHQLPAGSPPLEEASKQVLHVTVLHGRKITIDLEKFSNIDEALKSEFNLESLTPAELTLRRRVIKKCLESKRMTCSTVSSSTDGTVFLSGDRSTLWGALHVFHQSLNGRTDATLDIVLQDRDGKILFGATESDKAKVTFAHPAGLAAVSPAEQKANPSIDFIRLRLSRPLRNVRAFRMNTKAIARPSDVTYFLGYPGPTNDRKNWQKPDSDGTSQYVTYGDVITLEEHMTRSKKDPKLVGPETIKLVDQVMAVTNADAYPGMSGGPMLNKNGELIGIVIGGYPVDGSASEPRMAIAVRASWIKSVMSGALKDR